MFVERPRNSLTILILLGVPCLSFASNVDMRPGVTVMSERIQGIHHMALWVCVAIGIIVFGAMFYSMFAHRRSRNPQPATFHDSTTLEIAWTLIPFLILVVMAIQPPMLCAILRTTPIPN